MNKMKRNVLTILAIGTLVFFSCGEETSNAEAETMMNEIETNYAVTDSLNAEIEAIDEETSELDELVNDL